MDTHIFKQLNKDGLLSDEHFGNIQSAVSNRPISLVWELKILMYCGVLLLTTGLGIIVYKNLDSIGHLAIVIFIAAAMLLCFTFSYKRSTPFTFQKTGENNILQDYILLLGCLLMLILLGYLQVQYKVFGNRWGMATFIPMVILFLSAYYFDHLGVLSMAIINLAAWAGITVTPMQLLKSNDFSNGKIIVTGIFLAVFLLVISIVTNHKNIKKHFAFTYKHFGAHLLFISLIAGMAHFESYYLIFFLLIAAVGYFQFVEAFNEKSFYFIVVVALYGYVALSYLSMYLLFHSKINEGIYFAFFYFLLSAIGFIVLLISVNKKLKQS